MSHGAMETRGSNKLKHSTLEGGKPANDGWDTMRAWRRRAVCVLRLMVVAYVCVMWLGMPGCGRGRDEAFPEKTECWRGVTASLCDQATRLPGWWVGMEAHKGRTNWVGIGWILARVCACFTVPFGALLSVPFLHLARFCDLAWIYTL